MYESFPSTSQMTTPNQTNGDKIERFIPFRRSDIIKMCINDDGIPSENAQAFESFCEILSGIFHYKMHKSLETLKDCYAPFNPDTDTVLIDELSSGDKKNDELRLFAAKCGFECSFRRAFAVSSADHRVDLFIATGSKNCSDACLCRRI